MLLRPRQKLFVERSLAALDQHQNTLGVAPTGAGKTIMLSGVTGQWLANKDTKACVLAHRDELTAQNEAKFRVLIQLLLLQSMTLMPSHGTARQPSLWCKH